MDEEPGVQVQKPTSLLLRHSNNKMIDKMNGKKAPIHKKDKDGPKTEIIVVDETSKSKNNRPGIDHETCAMFAQIIDNEDAAWEILSDAASWEASFPKEILSETDSLGTALSLENELDELPPGWKKISDSGGSYFWNTETGKTQTKPPSFAEAATETTSSTSYSNNLVDNAAQTSEREGHMFLVRSLGWLPMETESLKPDISSSAVNSCIRLLSNNRSQIMDGVGVWGEGKDLMLLLSDNLLKIVEPVENTILQTQSIKHIRLWGVGRDSSYDFAYVVRDPATKVYKCHVFRCDAPAQAIAKQLHTICSSLVQQKRLNRQASTENPGADLIPTASSEPRQIFEAQFVGLTKVTSPTGITILKDAIKKLTIDEEESQRPVTVSVSASAVVVNDKDSLCIVNCRTRCLSFMGVGDDVKLFGFISVIAGEATCYVLQCEPNAAKLALAVQEACMLRYQKAIDSNQTVETSPGTPEHSKSLKKRVIKLFSGWRRSGS